MPPIALHTSPTYPSSEITAWSYAEGQGTRDICEFAAGEVILNSKVVNLETAALSDISVN